MEQGPSPIQRIRERISPETKEAVRADIERLDKDRKERVNALIEKMDTKRMEKVHLAYALISSGLPFEHDFIQGYLRMDTDYFLNESYYPKDLDLLEQVINEFDFERDQGKMFPLPDHSDQN